MDLFNNDTGASTLPDTVLLLFYGHQTVIWSLTVITLSLLSFFFLPGSKIQPQSRKSQRAKAMRQAFNALDRCDKSPNKSKESQNGPTSNKMQISQIWIYPIKSLRGCPVPQAVLTREGFYLDRRFMLLKVGEENSQTKLQNMAVPNFPAMSLFHTAIEGDKLIVSYRHPGTTEPSDETLEVPLEPSNFGELQKIPIDMHGSPTTAYNMGSKANDWFSESFGFQVMLVYWGGNPRAVLGNLPGKSANEDPKPKTAAAKAVRRLPIIGPWLGAEDDGIIAFNDCAPYLVINERSVAEVSTRLPEGMEMDDTKFRANIVVKGSDTAFEEDFWGQLTLGGDCKIILTANCGRCKSLNVDYTTGAAGKGKDGEILKLLQKDRRVDPGMKYSPIFGRYGFASQDSEGKVLSVGDDVFVSRTNDERTVFYWPGVSTT